VFPFAAAFAVACLLLSLLGAPLWLWILEVLILPILCFYAYRFDVLRRTTVLLYDLDPQAQKAYERLNSEVARLAACQGVWNVEQQTAVTNAKYHAGASHLLKRLRVRMGTGGPPRLKMNIDPLRIPVGRQVLYLLPDRILVTDSGGVGAVSYRDISVSIDTTNFIEGEGAPSDARVVDRTWKYVNKKGGPDKRFADNRELPVCQYEEMRLVSAQGLNELFHFSRVGVSAGFKAAVEQLATLGRTHSSARKAHHRRVP
jgi:hypothetical protein